MSTTLDLPTGALDVDAEGLLEVIASERRRRAVRALADNEGEMCLTPLARAVTRYGPDDDGSAAADGGIDAETAAVRTSLHHAHLPKLSDAGVVDYDADVGRVELTVPPDELPLVGD